MSILRPGDILADDDIVRDDAVIRDVLLPFFPSVEIITLPDGTLALAWPDGALMTWPDGAIITIAAS